MSCRAIYVAAVAALGIACVSVDALTARVAADGVPHRHHRAPLRHRLVGPIWYNPDYSTGSYSPSYSTGGYYHPGFSIKYHYPIYATAPVCLLAPAELASSATIPRSPRTSTSSRIMSFIFRSSSSSRGPVPRP